MPLTDTKLRNLKASDKLYRVADGRGLVIEVATSGTKLWRHRYRFNGKAQMLGLGKYPEVSLAKAREIIANQKRQLSAGIDPKIARLDARAKQINAQHNTFEYLAVEFLAKRERDGLKPHTLKKKRTLLAAILPTIGTYPIAQIDAPLLLQALKVAEKRGAHTVANEARALASEIFRFAISTGRATGDPSPSLKGALIAPTVRGQAAITSLPKLLTLLEKIKNYEGEVAVRNRLLVLAHTFVRPDELRLAKWTEIDFDQKLWSIPGHRMKMGLDHLVPLTPTVIQLFEEIYEVRVSDEHVMGSTQAKSGVISDMTFNKALRSLGYNGDVHVAHGFRKSASTILNEEGWNSEWIERQLSHVPRNRVAGIYNKAQYLAGRTKMMEAWSQMLDGGG